MTRRFILSFLSALLILLLAPLVPSAEAQASLVAVRVPVAGQELWARSGIADELVIDYGAFTWALVSPLNWLRSSPTLTLSGLPQSLRAHPGRGDLDPLLSPPR